MKKIQVAKVCASDSLGFSNNSLHFERNRTSRFTEDFKRRIKSFNLKDDVSRMTTGTKQTLTKDKLKMQKRFLMDTMENIHRRFLAETQTR